MSSPPPLTPSDLDEVVRRHVDAVDAIDVHTHLLPPSHGKQLLFGIDELLTYHYLVAELFMVMPLSLTEEDSVRSPGENPSPEEFFAWKKEAQAELIFEELFVKRSPLSEACRGVITTLTKLGLGEQLRSAAQQGTPGKRLSALRAWFAEQDPEVYLEKVFRLAGLKYAVMTNIPFDPEEAKHWFPSAGSEAPPPIPSRLKPALRVDPLFAGSWSAICVALRAASYEETIEGCYKYIKDWVQRMRPVYLMASTPPGFKFSPIASTGTKRDATSTPIPSSQDLLTQVVMRVAQEEKLPIAIKVGAVRKANPALVMAGDAVEVADLSFLYEFCKAYPTVKFLVTVLSTCNQHELCVIARKFGNLHVYGCWWFCNNPSIIDQTTRMRLEMLGTAFTCQHSDARVLDQLVYKWRHSRDAISPVLVDQYRKLLASGWEVHENDVQRDVHLLFGGAYEAFMAK